MKLRSQILECNMWHDQGEWVGCWEYRFWVKGLKRWQILLFYIVFELQRIFHISAARCPIEMGFSSKWNIFMDKWFILNNQNWILLTCDSFPLTMSHIIIFITALIFHKYSLKCNILICKRLETAQPIIKTHTNTQKTLKSAIVVHSW